MSEYPQENRHEVRIREQRISEGLRSDAMRAVVGRQLTVLRGGSMALGGDNGPSIREPYLVTSGAVTSATEDLSGRSSLGDAAQ